MNSSDRVEHLPEFILKMEKHGLPGIVIETFKYYYNKVLTGETGLIYDREIEPVKPDEIPYANHLQAYTVSGKKAIPHAVRITLNGGLGTSMGLTTAKSLLEVKDGQSFLEIIVQQTEKANVRLALMNSFSTHEDTLDALAKINPSSFPLTFLQHKFPKILQEGFAPVVWEKNPYLEWNPPGHGDIYTALLTSGMLQKLLDEDIQYAFISNSDNLGANLDESLLGYFAEKEIPFMMEVAERTPADAKGGHLARHETGALILRESAQCPKDELEAFRDIHCYGFFNTNNLWVNLAFLKNLIEEQAMIRLPMILNPKTLDPRDENSPKVFQVETAMGAAISLFEGAAAVKVPRSRFFPVKKCNDLLAVRSDCFEFSENGNLKLNPKRISDTPHIQLDSQYYGKIDQFNERFQYIPSLLECESFTVEGNIFFEKNIRIQGNVTIQGNHAKSVIPQGTLIDCDLML